MAPTKLPINPEKKASEKVSGNSGKVSTPAQKGEQHDSRTTGKRNRIPGKGAYRQGRRGRKKVEIQTNYKTCWILRYLFHRSRPTTSIIRKKLG